VTVQAVQDAWTSACEATGSATVVIPKGDYLVGPLNFTGPCKGSNIAIQLDGNLLGSNDLDKYTASWIELSHVNNIGITGSGTLDGQGTAVYSKSKTDNVKAMPNVRTFVMHAHY
jgi:galacturan 1,4-alpha-galacturonidase